MRRITLFAIIIAILVAPAFSKDKGHISVTAKAEIYNPPGDDLIAPMFTIEARYRFNAYLAAVGSGSWTQYDLGEAEVTYVPVAVDGEVHPLGRGVFDPFAGVGLAFNYKQYNYSIDGNDETDLTLGTEFFGGVSYKPKNQFGFELNFKYRIEDVVNAGDSGSWSLGGGVTGSWEKDL
jgi:hypothetical protein